MKCHIATLVREHVQHPCFQDIVDRVAAYGPEYLAENLVSLAEPVLVQKNWNGHAARSGSAICNFAVMIADAFEFAPADLANFRLNRPQAISLTGGTYGSAGNAYIEYMAVNKRKLVDGSIVENIDHKKFL